MNQLDLETLKDLEVENKRLRKVVRMVIDECKKQGGSRCCMNPIHIAAREALKHCREASTRPPNPA